MEQHGKLPRSVLVIKTCRSEATASLSSLVGVRWCMLQPGWMDLVTAYLGHPVLLPPGAVQCAQGSACFPPSYAQALLSPGPHSVFEKQHFIQWQKSLVAVWEFECRLVSW